VLAGAALAELLHDRIRQSFFSDGPKPSEAETLSDEERLDAMRADLIDELRVVLREELASVRGSGREDPVGPSPAEEAAPPSPPEAPQLRH
jgi:hypothetical protein